ncbi:hypothetical protein CN557_27045 [Bacillus wiedmannii]|uniref:hypothetical protein n=1 Tax=Bacillus wiedmannii TaxID=1890302 RepID=UPI000BF3A108|nr:hypothetical protein [Bacillus wiedmannii]PEP48939.1 hypothetical protein CN557_27045 [Bacillus wiedmannii]
MSIFSTVWIDGKIPDFHELAEQNKDRKWMFFLDTNFVIYARDYIHNKKDWNKLNPSLKNEFLSAVNIIKKWSNRIIYHYACEEAARDKKTGNFNSEKYRLLVACLEELFDKAYCKEILSENPSIDNDLSFSKVPLLRGNGLFTMQSALTYAAILKAYTMKHFTKHENGKEKICDYFNFLDEELDAFSPVQITFSIHYLGNELNILRRTSPNKGITEILNKIYAAAIDLQMPTRASQISGISNYQEIPIFVTFDKGSKLIFDSLLIEESQNTLGNHTNIPSYSFMIFYSSGWKNDEITELSQIASSISKRRRLKGKGADFNLDRILNICSSLEGELIEHKEALYINT